MYDIEIVNARSSVRMNPDNGCFVDTIDGLTGISASFDSVQNISGSGVSITGNTIASKTLTVKGKILDANTTVKQNMIDTLVPAAECTIYIYSGYSGSASDHRASRYRKAKVFVKTTPIITQEKHSAFSISFVMPNPYWEEVTAKTITPANTGTGNTNATITGDVDPEYEFSFTAAATIYAVTLYCGAAVSGNFLYLDFTRTEGGSIASGDSVRVYRDSGRLRVVKSNNLVLNQNIIQAAYTNSKLWYLPRGANRYWYSASGAITNPKIIYTPLHAGVLVDGV